MPTKHRPPAEIVSSISNIAKRVREGGNELTQRIERFQAFLSEMRGRTEATCSTGHPDGQDPEDSRDIGFCLRLHKIGKDWVISYAFFEDGEIAGSWELLKDAPLKYKIAGIKMFPDLLESIENTQERIVKNIDDVAATFDAFEKTLEVKAGG